MTHVLAETTITTSSYTAAAIAAPLFTANVPLAPPTSPPPLTAYPIPSLRPPPRAPAHLLPSGRCTLGDGLASCGAAQDRLYLGRRRVRRGIGVGVTGRHQDASCLSWRGPIPPAPGARGAHPSSSKETTDCARHGTPNPQCLMLGIPFDTCLRTQHTLVAAHPHATTKENMRRGAVVDTASSHYYQAWYNLREHRRHPCGTR